MHRDADAAGGGRERADRTERAAAPFGRDHVAHGMHAQQLRGGAEGQEGAGDVPLQGVPDTVQVAHEGLRAVQVFEQGACAGNCGKMHAHKHKQRLDERYQQHGDEVLRAVPVSLKHHLPEQEVRGGGQEKSRLQYLESKVDMLSVRVGCPVQPVMDPAVGYYISSIGAMPVPQPTGGIVYLIHY
eukprot:TRINITY_DN1219_c0_g1_i3.p1 TRINITY_DN1219_c0_g1~~TRINITY_DN1219_c0_g1_i3.p1  ORF type:complete len:185 (+),score=37.68 TRINITY_DN1219_c0_g1_i3:454-1008(+)